MFEAFIYVDGSVNFHGDTLNLLNWELRPKGLEGGGFMGKVREAAKKIYL